MACIKKGRRPTFDPSRLLSDEALSSTRGLIRNRPTAPDKLEREVQRLFRFCVKRLPAAFADNKLKMEAFIDLPRVYPMDVIDGVKARFEKADFKVEYTFQDSDPNFDHLGFTPPEDWIDRLLSMAREDEAALDSAVQSLVSA
jgi:hypothetical protein